MSSGVSRAPSSALLGTKSSLFGPAYTRLAGPDASEGCCISASYPVGGAPGLQTRSTGTGFIWVPGNETPVFTVGWPSPQLA